MKTQPAIRKVMIIVIDLNPSVQPVKCAGMSRHESQMGAVAGLIPEPGLVVSWKPLSPSIVT